MEENTEKQRNNVLQELYQTELSYVEDLQLLLEVFLFSLHQQSNFKNYEYQIKKLKESFFNPFFKVY